MSNAYLSPIIQDCQFNNDGTFLAAGLVWFYQAGTTTPLLAYTSPDASVAWTNPIVLNARGETGGEIWLKAAQAYKIVIETPPEYGQTHGIVISNYDNITGVNDPGTTSIQNWIAFGATPTYVSTTSFTVSGDQRSVFLKSRRLKTTNTSGTVYSTVVSSTFATGTTTVVVSNDYGEALDSGLSAISYGFIETGAVSSIPVGVNAGSAASGSQYQMWIDYDGTNLKWAKNADALSADWPMNASKAAASSVAKFIATGTSGSDEARFTVSCPTVNDTYLFNNAASWGINGVDGGIGIQYTRSTGKFTYGGFNFPAAALPIAITLPNGMKLCTAQATASTAGVDITLPATYTSNSTYTVVATAITATAAKISIEPTSSGTIRAHCDLAGTTSIHYFTLGY